MRMSRFLAAFALAAALPSVMAGCRHEKIPEWRRPYTHPSVKDYGQNFPDYKEIIKIITDLANASSNGDLTLADLRAAFDRLPVNNGGGTDKKTTRNQAVAQIRGNWGGKHPIPTDMQVFLLQAIAHETNEYLQHGERPQTEEMLMSAAGAGNADLFRSLPSGYRPPGKEDQVHWTVGQVFDMARDEATARAAARALSVDRESRIFCLDGNMPAHSVQALLDTPDLSAADLAYILNGRARAYAGYSEGLRDREYAVTRMILAKAPLPQADIDAIFTKAAANGNSAIMRALLDFSPPGPAAREQGLEALRKNEGNRWDEDLESERNALEMRLSPLIRPHPAPQP